jgi:hypothetical protein
MGKRAVADVVHQDASHSAVPLGVGNGMAFGTQLCNGFRHQVHRSQRMMETCMNGSRINVKCQTQLPDSVQPLDVRMIDNPENKVVGDGDEAENGVVDYFCFVVHFIFL